MNTRTEVMQDRRTRRLRTRADVERHNLEDFFDDLDVDDCDGSCRAGRWCVIHGSAP